ncbi:MAG: discoidin domain-containing protein, partial [Acidobacteriota bacterium]
ALPLAIAAALGFARLAKRLPARWQGAAATACVALIVLDSWPLPIPMHAPRGQYTLPAAARDAAVIELPLGDVVDDDISAMIRGMSHGRPVVNGYTGYFPGPYNMLQRALRERDPSVLKGLATFDPLCIVIDRRLLLARNSRLMTEAAGAHLIGTDRDFAFYRLERQPEPVVPGRGTVDITSAVATNWPEPTREPIDGRVTTFWESLTRQRGREGMTLTLKEASPVSGVVLSLGDRLAGYPRQLVVETSLDATSWTPAWEGPTAGLAYVGAVRDFSQTRFTVSFKPRDARFVRLLQTGSAEDRYWTIAEVEVLR